MINESSTLLRIRHEVLINKDMHNGKIKCFLCLDDQTNAEMSLEDFDLTSMMIRIKSKKNKNDNFLKNIFDNIDTRKLDFFRYTTNSKEMTSSKLIKLNSNNLITPCLCKKSIHTKCLINYCFINLSFQCPVCKINHGVEFISHINQGYKRFIILVSLFISLLNLGLLSLTFLFFGNYFNFAPKWIIWNFLLGIHVLVTNILIGYFSFSYIKSCHTKSKITEPYFYLDKECTDAMRKVDSKKGEDIYHFLQQMIKCERVELIEKKINNMRLIETSTHDRNKILQFISENNMAALDANHDLQRNETTQLRNYLTSYQMTTLVKQKTNGLMKQKSLHNMLRIRPQIDRTYTKTRTRDMFTKPKPVEKPEGKKFENNLKILSRSNLNDSENKSPLFKYSGTDQHPRSVTQSFDKNALNKTIVEIEEDNEQIRKYSQSIDKKLFFDICNPINFPTKKGRFTQSLKKLPTSNYENSLNCENNDINIENKQIFSLTDKEIFGFHSSADDSIKSPNLSKFAKEKILSSNRILEGPLDAEYKPAKFKNPSFNDKTLENNHDIDLREGRDINWSCDEINKDFYSVDIKVIDNEEDELTINFNKSESNRTYNYNYYGD